MHIRKASHLENYIVFYRMFSFEIDLIYLLYNVYNQDHLEIKKITNAHFYKYILL